MARKNNVVPLVQVFEWEDFQQLADEWLLQANGHLCREALLRCVISRSYYAAYHVSCEFLMAAGAYPTEQEIKAAKVGAHQVVIDVFLASPQQAWQKIGKELGFLKGYRHKAD